MIMYSWVKTVNLIKEVIIYKNSCDTDRSWILTCKRPIQDEIVKTIKISNWAWEIEIISLKNKYHPEGHLY